MNDTPLTAEERTRAAAHPVARHLMGMSDSLDRAITRFEKLGRFLDTCTEQEFRAYQRGVVPECLKGLWR